MTIPWEDPPADATFTEARDYLELHRAMAEQPGRWLLWSECSHRSNASNLRHRRPELEVATAPHPTEAGKVRLYARHPPA